MRPGTDLSLTINEWEGEEGYRVFLAGTAPSGALLMNEAHKVESFDQAVRTAVEMLAEFQRRRLGATIPSCSSPGSVSGAPTGIGAGKGDG
jgi:hypothetical protein